MGYMRGIDRFADKLEEDLGELREKHDETPDKDFDKYKNRPVDFIIHELIPKRERWEAFQRVKNKFDLLPDDADMDDFEPGEEPYFGYGPWKRQVDVAESVLENRNTIVRSNNSAGKDWLAAHLALWWVYAHRGLVLFTGPTQRQVINVCMGEVADAFAKAPDLPGEMYKSALSLGQEEDAGILAFTSTSASKLTGFHGARVMGVITEAQEVEEFAFDGVAACATGPEDRLLAMGNPTKPAGPFYQRSMSDRWEDIQIGAEEHPNVRSGCNIIRGAVSKEWVEDRQVWKDNAPQKYRSRVKGEFPDKGEGAIISRAWIDDAVEAWHEAMEIFTEHQGDEEWAESFSEELRRRGEDAVSMGEEIAAEALHSPPTLALDPSRYGSDETVLAIRYGPLLTELRTWQQASTMTTTGRVRQFADELGVRTLAEFEEEEGDDAPLDDMERIIIDCIGPGQGVYDRLEELGYNVGSYKAGRSPSRGNKEDYLDARSESFWGLRRRLQNGEIALPDDQTLKNELATVQWEPTSSSKIRVQKKDKIRKELGHSPDRADAVVMSFYAGNVDMVYREILV